MPRVYINIVVVDLVGTEHAFEVEIPCSAEALLIGIRRGLGLGPISDVTLRGSESLREGAVVVLDRGGSTVQGVRVRKVT